MVVGLLCKQWSLSCWSNLPIPAAASKILRPQSDTALSAPSGRTLWVDFDQESLSFAQYGIARRLNHVGIGKDIISAYKRWLV